MSDPATFQALARTAQDIAETRGSNTKIDICAYYFRSIEKTDDLQKAARFLGEGAFTRKSGRHASVGGRTVGGCAARFAEIDYDKVFKPCRTATGSTSETIEKLLRNIPEARKKRRAGELTLKAVEEIFFDLYKNRKRRIKQQILTDAWKQMSALEIKYFIRVLRQGSLRIGFEAKSITKAIAEAYEKDLDEIRHVHMLTGSIGETAVLARNDQLQKAQFELHQPVSFMLASAIETRSVDNYDAYLAEEKFDGMRAQVHVSHQKVTLYSRDLNELSQTFPEIPTFFLSRKTPSMVMDGEICVYKDDIIQPFQLLQKRMGVKKPDRLLLRQYPVLFISYDLLYLDGNPLFDRTLMERRKQLLEVAENHEIPYTSQYSVESQKDVDRLFQRAVDHGNEGLMLKDKESVYEYGKRGKSWLKVKEPGGSLDTVILYAHAGSGKRGGTYSDFTLGINVRDDERYEEEFIPIGKAYGGYTDDELHQLNDRISELTVARYGPTLALEPSLMVEIEFDDIQVNKRTKAGYTLRLPRFRAIRWDMDTNDADTLKNVEALYRQKLNKSRKKQGNNPSFRFKPEE